MDNNLVIEHFLTVDIEDTEKEVASIVAKQNNNYHLIHFFITKDDVALDLSGKTVRIYGEKPDGTIIFNNLEITNPKMGKCDYKVTNNALAQSGHLKLEISVYSGQEVVASRIFTIRVKKTLRDDDAIESTNEFGAFTSEIARLEELISAGGGGGGGTGVPGSKIIIAETSKIRNYSDAQWKQYISPEDKEGWEQISNISKIRIGDVVVIKGSILDRDKAECFVYGEVTKKTGNTVFTKNNGYISSGKNGTNGVNGQNGIDGFSPTVEVRPGEGVNTVVITDKDGGHYFNVNDGKNGTPGPKGEPGEQGKDALINGVNTLTLKEGANISLHQAGNTLTISATSGGEGGKGSVDSVNGKTGAVILGAEDIAFNDGETFQDKLNAGTLKGQDGKDGAPGKDGLTTSISLNSKKYAQVNGTISLPELAEKTEVQNLEHDKVSIHRYASATDKITQEIARDIISNYGNYEGKLIEFLTNGDMPNKTFAYGYVMSDAQGNQYLIEIKLDGTMRQWNKTNYQDNYVKYEMNESRIDTDSLTLDHEGDSARYVAGLNNAINKPELSGQYGAMMILPYNYQNQLQLYIDVSNGKLFTKTVTGTDGQHSFGTWQEIGSGSGGGSGVVSDFKGIVMNGQTYRPTDGTVTLPIADIAETKIDELINGALGTKPSANGGYKIEILNNKQEYDSILTKNENTIYYILE